MTDRIPPQDLDMEQSVLGAMIIDPDCIPDVDAELRAEDYYRPAHATLHRIIMRLHAASDPVDMMTIQAALKAADEYERAGGVAYLVQLTDACPTAANAVAYAVAVREHAVRRRYIAAANEIVTAAYDLYQPLDSLAGVAAASAQIDTRGSDRCQSLGSLVHLVIDTAEERANALSSGARMSGITSACEQLDEITDGWQPAELTILGARPSTGKTALSLQWAIEAAHAGHSTVYASAEMSPQAIATRANAYLSGVNSRDIRTGRASAGDWNRIMEGGRIAQGLPLTIVNAAGMRPAELESIVRRTRNVGLVVVDYLQLLTPNAHGGNRTEDVSSISRDLKTLAVRNHTHVMALSQLARGVESRSDSTPQLSDLRESGGLEADADLVMFLWKSTQQIHGGMVVNFSIAKNRNGRCARASWHCQPWCGRFTWQATQQ